MNWMIEKAILCGLPIEESDKRSFSADIDKNAAIGENLDPIKNQRRTIYSNDQFHPSAQLKTLIV